MPESVQQDFKMTLYLSGCISTASASSSSLLRRVMKRLPRRRGGATAGAVPVAANELSWLAAVV
eukprot:6187965-Pleurochrysis_carterae.AAC.4